MPASHRVFLGFGSMPVLDPEQLLAMATDTTRSLGVRTVINLPQADRDRMKAGLPEHVRLVGAVNHELLLPPLRGGSSPWRRRDGGCLTPSRAADDGLLGVAFHPFWGQRLEQLGAGAHVPFKRLDASNLEAGLRRLLAAPTRERAGALGAAIRAEGDGSEAAAQLLEGWSR